MKDIEKIWLAFENGSAMERVEQFCSEEDNKPYRVWKIETTQRTYVLKLVSEKEREVYQVFFPNGGGPVPVVYGFAEYNGEQYMLMEYVPGESLGRCTREKLKLTLDALIGLQDRFWENKRFAEVGYGFFQSFPNRKKRLPFMEDLKEVYQKYLDVFCSVPRTLCNDDMLPFNVLANENRAVIIDWEFAGILPYPCALARLIAFGEDGENVLFQMSEADRQFAIRYYYDNLIGHKGISWDEYLYTVKLFLLKEYSEWVYCANSSGDLDMPYYKKYYAMAKSLAMEMDLLAQV